MGEIQQRKIHFLFKGNGIRQLGQKIFSLKKKILFPTVLILIIIVFLISLQFKKEQVVTIDEEEEMLQQEETRNLNVFSGLSCENNNQRAFAVTFASDPAARPLSGLSQADWVFEMPVITGSITRFLAVYGCGLPEEVGSLRSARHDFIPLAEGMDAILVHWGGSHFALDDLDAGVMDNIDGLKNFYGAFYRKLYIAQPHNGFASGEGLLESTEKHGYRQENTFEGYHFNQEDKSDLSDQMTLRIKYPYPYNVSYVYMPKDNSYFRWRANLKEFDEEQKQIAVKNIVVMRVVSKQIEGDYNDLEIEGRQGDCEVYQNGKIIPCVWKKGNNNQSKLYFLNKETYEEVDFVPGRTWVEIVEPYQEVIWE